jgi:DNA-binding MarR family transcriptional regulator
MRRLTDIDYRHLLELRTGLRRFLRWSAGQAEAAGLTAAQHQLLLAVRGHEGAGGPTIGELADYLLLRHHSAVELVDRAAATGLVVRGEDSRDSRVVRVRLTAEGAERLERLSEHHLEEIGHLAPTMRALWSRLERAADGTPHPASPAGAGLS